MMGSIRADISRLLLQEVAANPAESDIDPD